MNKIRMSLLLIISLCFTANAQTNTLKIKILIENTNQPLAGATVYFENLNIGEITNFDGIAVFSNIPDGEHRLLISYIGFETIEKYVTFPNEPMMTFFLHESGQELEEIVIQSNRSTRTIRKIPTRIEFIGAEELGEKTAMNAANISMVLRESTGIQMQQTSLSSGNTNIRIQGLDGRYTQLLKDGFPLYGGFSSGLSIMQIPPLDLQQFEIIKGSSSTLYGGGAIAGLVNMISKTPKNEPELDIMFTQTQASGTTANIFYSKRNEKSGVSLYGSGNYQKAYDPEGDGFSNLPKTKSISFNPKYYYYPSDKTTFWIGVNGSYDDRIGGDIKKIEKGVFDDHQYTEENTSIRLSTQAVYTTKIDSVSSFSLKNSISYFDRDLKVQTLNFRGKQLNSFTEATYQRSGLKFDWILGSNLYTVNFDEKTTGIERDRSDTTAGIFVNSIYDLSEEWILETGFRADYAKDWGVFPLPRISILYRPHNNGFSSRIGGGLGYKIPDMFTEQAAAINYKNVLPINKDELNAEKSIGLNLDFNYKTRLSDEIGVSFNQLFYVTSLQHSLLLEEIDNNQFKFKNASGAIMSKGSETNMKFTYKDFRWFLNYALIDTRLNYLPGNPQKPLTAKHNAGSVIMYENETWRIGYETYYTGQQVLLNGETSTDFITMGLLVMRNFKWGSTFVNFENFTDQGQSKFSPLVLPPHEDPVFAEIYAPTDGFILSIGIIIKPFGNKGHH